MDGGRWRNWLARCLIVLLALAAGTAARAQDFSPGSTCHIAAGESATYEHLSAHPADWTCTPSAWPMNDVRALQRFDLRGSDAPQPRMLVTRLTRFKAMRITVVNAAGEAFHRDIAPQDMRPATHDWLMSAPLPAYSGKAAAIVVRTDGARHAGLFSQARMLDGPQDPQYPIQVELMLAALCGMLFLPLVFNFAFYRVLRETFLLWHAAAVVFMLVQTFVTSGLINRFTTLGIDQLTLLSVASWGCGILAAAMFSLEMIETGKIDPLHRRLTLATGPWIAVWSLVYLYAGEPVRPWANLLYLASFLPVLGLFAWLLAVAARRGSRTVKFHIFACLPLMVTGAVRIFSALGVTEAPLEMQFEQHASIGLQVIIASLGVADRFMVVKRQRDRAREQSRVFEALAERDALTGLLNRRAVESRFAQLQAQGFSAMAIIDLDRFKSINDCHGHTVGDLVLRAAARALAPDDDTLAVRLGGEEFLLILRGKNIASRAERRRRAIATRVAADVPGLANVVTASMGLVENPPDAALNNPFEQWYAHCDRLLYEAKHNGRNRTMSARVQVFGSPRDAAIRAA